jgi:hypothetical protein
MNPWFADEILERVLNRRLDAISSAADQLYEERRRTLRA